MSVVESGTPVTATIEVSVEAAGTARLGIGSSSAQGTKSDWVDVAPGGTRSVTITPIGFGIMRVHVDMAGSKDEGVLTVDPPGPVEEPIEGDTNLRYTVIEP